MKKSDLKELIRNSIIKELEYQDDDAALGSMYSPVYEKKDKEEDIEITADETDTVEEPAADASSSEDPALSDTDQEYLNSLEDLKNKAKEMGDEKLENQIDNTITYFTRQHVVKEGDTDYVKEISIYEPEEMGNLVNLNDVKTLVSSAQNIIKTLKDEGFTENDIYDFIVDKITTLDDGSESLMENHERHRLQVIAGIIK